MRTGRARESRWGVILELLICPNGRLEEPIEPINRCKCRDASRMGRRGAVTDEAGGLGNLVVGDEEAGKTGTVVIGMWAGNAINVQGVPGQS